MYAAIDVGGTKTLVAVFTENGKLKEEIKFPTPKLYEDFVKELAVNVAKLSTTEFQAFAVAAPGKIDRKHGLGVNFGNLDWSNVPLLADVEAIIKSPGLIENDAKAAAFSEALEIKDQYSKVLYITVSTGIGGGYIINGRINPIFEDIEIGHILLEHGDRLERWEDFASGSAIYEKYGKKASDIPADDTQTWYGIARNLAVGIIDLIATLQPEVIVIGGGVGTHFNKFETRLKENLEIYENPMVSIPPIVQAKRSEQAVIYGCYELAKDKYGRRHS